jgi:hypothetical protein
MASTRLFWPPGSQNARSLLVLVAVLACIAAGNAQTVKRPPKVAAITPPTSFAPFKATTVQYLTTLRNQVRHRTCHPVAI